MLKINIKIYNKMIYHINIYHQIQILLMPTAAKRQIVQQNIDEFWNYSYLSEHKSITWENVIQNPNKPWNYSLLFTNNFNNRKYYWTQKLHKYINKKSYI
jgi:hypothetical protein